MRRVLLIFFSSLAVSFLFSQPYGNEWINTSRTHYKIKVTQDGMYRVPYSTLFGVNPNIGSIQVENFIMYHNGQPVPIYISSNTTLGANDYIEFYGERNKGHVDSILYRTSAHQINPSRSLFTDTAIYFLTTNNLTNNPRFREEQNNLIGALPAENYYMAKAYGTFSPTLYFAGKYTSLGSTELYKSIYDEGEGYAMTPYYRNNAAVNVTVPTPFVYASGPNASMTVYYASNSARESHRTRILLNNNQAYLQPVADTGFRLHRVTGIPISNAQLISGNNTLNFQDMGTGISQQQSILGYVEIMYPRTFNFGGANKFYFNVAADPVNKKYLEISGFNDNGTQPVLYDLTNGLYYRSVQPPGSSPLRFNLTPSAIDREMYVRSGDPSAYITVVPAQVSAIDFKNFMSFSNQGEYVIISHTKLMNDGPAIANYRLHRAAKYAQPQVIDIEELYDQFGYGIRKSPLAIRNFIRYAKANWQVDLQHVFLIGKGRENPSMRSSASAYNQCLIPTFGYPGSDNLLAATRNNDTALVTIGRLAAENGSQVSDYLDKVITYETEQNQYVSNQTIPPKLWQKQLLHFSGGTTPGEQVSFRNYVNSYASIARDTLWGTNVTSYSKTSSAPIDQSLSQIIRNKINEGVSWITFFGHSATGAFDFSIDEPENYTNVGKYPVILSNGCFSGFVHDAAKGYSERFVFQPNAGAIAFIATTGLSAPSGLNAFSDILYQKMCRSDYNAPLGQMLRNTYNTVVTTQANAANSVMVAYEMTLHGDPGIKVNQYPKPDYAIDESSVYFNPSIITPGVDTFDVNLVVTNLGKAIKDSIAVTLKRTVFDANGNPESFNYRKVIPATYYRDTVVFKLPVNISTLGYGQNLFEPYVEADRLIDEMAEGNNGLLSAIVTYIQNDDIIPIYPYEFAIVPEIVVTLKASTINPFAAARNYRFEIDTTENFDSPAKRFGIVYQSGGVVRWTTDAALYQKDSTVFYWRVGKDSVGATWHYSSFIYLKDEYPGWNQSHYYQWKKDSYAQMNLDNDRVFRFPPTTNQIRVGTGVAMDIPGGNLDRTLLGWDYNNVNMHQYRMGGCGYSAGITFAVIDSVTGAAWQSENRNNDNWGDRFGNYHCSDKYWLQNGFDFLTTGNHPVQNRPWSQVIKDFIDAVPCGHYILMYSANIVPYTNWDTTLVQELSMLGFQAQLFQAGAIKGPFVFFTRKCDINYIPFYTYVFNGFSTPYAKLDTSFTFQGAWFQGSFTTPKIGPAMEWGSVHWKWQPLNNQPTDRDTLDILGVNISGVDTLLISTTQPDNFISQINAATYPYLRLRLRTRDDLLRTPAQMIYWRVLFKKPPEAAINPAAHFVISDSLSIGQNFHVEVALENVTEVPMDSMLTKYTLRDAFGTVNFPYIRYDSLRGLDTMILVYDFPLSGNNFNGLNKLIIEANPEDDQIEQYHFNNFAEIDFSASGDDINPLLDVTFDGQRILDGDIVSAKPNILIILRDENKFLALDTSSLVTVYLKHPNEATARKIEYDDAILKFYPADATNLPRSNKAQVEFKPTLPVDGTYELLIRNSDRNGNNSSSTIDRFDGNVFFDYKISFEVVNKPMITNVLNYPNPFTTATKFIFTITGSEVPDFMKIQIMTIKGTVVKEIMKEELGNLRIGRNITEYTWDGRDEYGDILANGVYFYHVVTRLNDQRMDHMSQGYDKFFKKGFGKLVIIR